MTHKKMFQFLILAVVTAMILASPLLAGTCCQKKAEPGMMMDQGCMMFKHIPNLSDEQKGKLEKLHLDCQEMMPAAKAEMEKQALEMKGLMKDPVDVKKIEAKIDEIAMMKAGMQKKCLAHCLAVRALLTDEQKAKFGEMGCCGMMGGCQMHMQGGMKGHGMKMEKGKCPKAKEEEKK